jgi:uncharacterized protein YkwD
MSDPTHGDLVEALNQARANAGLPALAPDPGLAAQAQAWAERMAQAGTISHGDYADRISSVHPGVPDAEDVAEGQPTASAVVAAWMDDRRHRLILLGDYDSVGVGSAPGDAGMRFWCVDFAKVEPSTSE